MIQRMLPALFIPFLVFGHLLALDRATEFSNALDIESRPAILPSPILKLMAFEFDGVLADFLFLKASVFNGELQEKKGSPQAEDWKWIAEALKASTDLDPYFYDPYYFGNAVLPWRNLVEEGNVLLEKGTLHRIWDWTLPFYLGFNYFYFLQDNERAAKWLMESSRRPGAYATIGTLAARLAYEGNQTETAILFLEQVIRDTEDEAIRAMYETRLEALRGIWVLEQAVREYKSRFGWDPANLWVLLVQGFIQEIPRDPYGGTFYLAEDGSVKTTSNLR